MLPRPNRARYPGRIANSERTGDGLLEVLADHSTDGSGIAESGRWGTEAQGTHCREGEAGYDVLLG